MASEAIRVGIRLRPLVPHEKGQKECFGVSNEQVSVISGVMEQLPKGCHAGPWKFDKAMDSGPNAEDLVDNQKCYEHMGRNLIGHALEGFNSCLFCYGQTGTGKTTTILGDKDNGPGILILMLEGLFEEVLKAKARGGGITVSIQMLEVYNEKVFDLLEPPGAHNNVEVHVLPHGVEIKGPETKDVTSVEQIMELIDQGNGKKHMAATAMNPQSSRGHTIYKLGIHKDEGDFHSSAEMYFADLAGHENEKTTKVTGDRMVELSFINKSLMWLQRAIHSLSGKSHKGTASSNVSQFRNSKLTLLLANALTGNARINLIVTISPAALHFPTSSSSLSFANEVKHMAVEVHSSASTHADPAIVIQKLEQEVKELKDKLAQAPDTKTADVSTASSSAELTEARREVQQLKSQLLASANASTGSNSAELEEARREVQQLRTQLLAAASPNAPSQDNGRWSTMVDKAQVEVERQRDMSVEANSKSLQTQLPAAPYCAPSSRFEFQEPSEREESLFSSREVPPPSSVLPPAARSQFQESQERAFQESQERAESLFPSREVALPASILALKEYDSFFSPRTAAGFSNGDGVVEKSLGDLRARVTELCCKCGVAPGATTPPVPEPLSPRRSSPSPLTRPKSPPPTMQIGAVTVAPQVSVAVPGTASRVLGGGSVTIPPNGSLVPPILLGRLGAVPASPRTSLQGPVPRSGSVPSAVSSVPTSPRASIQRPVPRTGSSVASSVPTTPRATLTRVVPRSGSALVPAAGGRTPQSVSALVPAAVPRSGSALVPTAGGKKPRPVSALVPPASVTRRAGSVPLASEPRSASALVPVAAPRTIQWQAAPTTARWDGVIR